MVSLNVPNNPSGYTPTKAEALRIVRALTEAAEAGTRLVVVCDNAYYGIFFDPACELTHPGQTIVLKALRDSEFRRQQAEKVAILGARAEATRKECQRAEYDKLWDLYPYNSGYFMCLCLKGADADTGRVRLLDEHGVRTIALGQANLRVAFSCLTEAQIPGVFSAIAAVVRGMCQPS
ncbi:MAG: aminotransferase class I/II-fold pyridoxal phosphate-dependent enzyme [Holophaga sp.]